MIVQTRNTIYTIKDLGDGGFSIYGNPKYCPAPTVCRLTEPPTLGRRMLVYPVTGPRKGRPFLTTEIVSIVEA